MKSDHFRIFHRRYFRILVILLLIATILRETGYVNLSYYKSNIQKSSSLNWSVTGTSVDLSNLELKNLNEPTHQMIAIFCDGECVSGDCDGTTLLVYFTYDASPFLWLPLYKSADFSEHIQANFSISHRTNKDGSGHIGSRMFDMSAIVNGHVNIKGICSRRQARLLVVQSIADEIRMGMEQKMEEEMNSN